MEVKERITPRFVPAHDSNYRYLGENKDRVEHVLDKIHIDHTTFIVDYSRDLTGQVKPYKRDGQTIGAWVIPDEYVSRLDELDNQILELQKARRAVTIAAAAHGRLLKLKDLETESETA